jgi:hypothetical protein
VLHSSVTAIFGSDFEVLNGHGFEKINNKSESGDCSGGV